MLYKRKESVNETKIEISILKLVEHKLWPNNKMQVKIIENNCENRNGGKTARLNEHAINRVEPNFDYKQIFF